MQNTFLFDIDFTPEILLQGDCEENFDYISGCVAAGTCSEFCSVSVLVSVSLLHGELLCRFFLCIIPGCNEFTAYTDVKAYYGSYGKISGIKTEEECKNHCLSKSVTECRATTVRKKTWYCYAFSQLALALIPTSRTRALMPEGNAVSKSFNPKCMKTFSVVCPQHVQGLLCFCCFSQTSSTTVNMSTKCFDTLRFKVQMEELLLLTK